MAAPLPIDKLFVSKIVQERDITQVADIPPEFLFDENYREAYRYIRQYHSEHGEVPTVRVMNSDVPNIKLVQVDEPWADIIERVNTKYLAGVLERGLSEVVDKHDAGDIQGAINFLGVMVSQVHTAVPTSRDTNVAETGEERLARYQERRDNPGTLVGVPTGFPTIDRATQGLQPGQLITITGLTKASKSTLAMVIAMAIQEAGKRVVYCTYEQTNEEQERRLDAYRAGINDNLLNSGTATNADWDKVVKGIHVTNNLPALHFVEDAMTVTAVSSKCDLYDPEVIIVDGAYMMEDEQGETPGSPAALTNIVKSFKSMAMRRKICVILVTQSTPARTKGETLNNDSIMGSRSFAHYSNVVIGIERPEEDADMRKLKILLSRSCPNITVMADWDYDTATFQENDEFLLGEGDQELDAAMRGNVNDDWGT